MVTSGIFYSYTTKNVKNTVILSFVSIVQNCNGSFELIIRKLLSVFLYQNLFTFVPSTYIIAFFQKYIS